MPVIFAHSHSVCVWLLCVTTSYLDTERCCVSLFSMSSPDDVLFISFGLRGFCFLCTSIGAISLSPRAPRKYLILKTLRGIPSVLANSVSVIVSHPNSTKYSIFSLIILPISSFLKCQNLTLDSVAFLLGCICVKNCAKTRRR